MIFQLGFSADKKPEKKYKMDDLFLERFEYLHNRERSYAMLSRRRVKSVIEGVHIWI